MNPNQKRLIRERIKTIQEYASSINAGIEQRITEKDDPQDFDVSSTAIIGE